MTVLMTFRVPGDPDALERHADANPEEMQRIAERAKEHGLISHRFYGGDGEILVVDEWDSPESFQRFFDASPEIPEMMKAIARGEPNITFWRKLETHDEV
jgi:heme-degrading monooxygenase HmoA